MKLYYLAIATFLFICCAQTEKDNNTISQYHDSTNIAQIPTNAKLLVDTLTINENSYFVFQNIPGSDTTVFFTIINSEKDTLLQLDHSATNGFEFEDIDEDGTLDIRLDNLSNVGGISELIMFDSINGKFREVENFDQFPQPIKIKNSACWYSYHRSGCADSNWGSELFRINDFVAIEIGKIEGVGCEGEEINGIFIYKIGRNTKTIIHFEPREPGYYEDKYDYITNYWTSNHKSFEE